MYWACFLYSIKDLKKVDVWVGEEEGQGANKKWQVTREEWQGAKQRKVISDQVNSDQKGVSDE
jgi:hypothetical protein